MSPVSKHMTTQQLWFQVLKLHIWFHPCGHSLQPGAAVALVLDPRALNLEHESRRVNKGLGERCSRAVITQIQDYLGCYAVSHAQNKVGVGDVCLIRKESRVDNKRGK